MTETVFNCKDCEFFGINQKTKTYICPNRQCLWTNFFKEYYDEPCEDFKLRKEKEE